MTDTKGPKKISARDIVIDLRDGMTDTELMEKYDISLESLHDVFIKLVDAKLATNTYFSKRAQKQANASVMKDEANTCPFCGYTSEMTFGICPHCNREPSEWLDTAELTRMLSFE